MKKYYVWIIISGMVSGAIFKDLCFGPFISIFIGAVIGIPLFLFLRWVLYLFINHTSKRPNIIASSISIFFLIILHWFLFQPPGWLVFMQGLAYPIPPSVKYIDARWRSGFCDVPVYIKFEINREDLNKIIRNKEFEIDTLEKDDIQDINRNEWFNITNINETEVYYKESGGYVDETLDYYIYEYIIYDPNTKQAIYSGCYWS